MKIYYASFKCFITSHHVMWILSENEKERDRDKEGEKSPRITTGREKKKMVCDGRQAPYNQAYRNLTGQRVLCGKQTEKK